MIKCSREAESHGGALRKVDSVYVCQQCWAEEQGIEIRKATGKQTICPKCGKVLLTRHRNGSVSITSLSTKGSKAILKCECGYEKVIRNPLGGNLDRNEAARQRLKQEARQRLKQEARGQGPGNS